VCGLNVSVSIREIVSKSVRSREELRVTVSTQIRISESVRLRGRVKVELR
jgi:hypothetical protein